jgi:hypothetical protein
MGHKNASNLVRAIRYFWFIRGWFYSLL